MKARQFREFIHSVAGSIKAEKSDAEALRFLNRMCADRVESANNRTQRRRSYLNSITSNTEDGQVAIVVGGMDCDCCSYEGHVYLVEATTDAVDAELESISINAEGPIHWEIKSPSAAAKVERTSRDLALEAFENGHPHSIHY